MRVLRYLRLELLNSGLPSRSAFAVQTGDVNVEVEADYMVRTLLCEVADDENIHIYRRCPQVMVLVYRNKCKVSP